MNIDKIHLEKLEVFKTSNLKLFQFIQTRNNSRGYLHDDREFDPWDFQATKAYLYCAETEYYGIINEHDVLIGYFRFHPRFNEIGMDLDLPFRDQGLGTKLYEKFLPKFWELSNNELYLRVLKKNERALHVYNKLGFEIIDETDIDLQMKLFNYGI